MYHEIMFNCALIILARLCDVSFSTLRTVSIVQGHRGKAFIFGFIEVFIWVNVVSRVISQLTVPIYGVSYAFGFALGSYLGLFIEEKLAWGEGIVRVFTRNPQIEEALRTKGYGVTVFEGRGKDGPISELFIQSTRKNISEVIDLARSIDPKCYYLVGSVNYTSDRRNDT